MPTQPELPFPALPSSEETDRAAEGTVVFIYRAGYEWNGEVYRPAQVRVAKRPANGSMQ